METVRGGERGRSEIERIDCHRERKKELKKETTRALVKVLAHFRGFQS